MWHVTPRNYKSKHSECERAGKERNHHAAPSFPFLADVMENNIVIHFINVSDMSFFFYSRWSASNDIYMRCFRGKLLVDADWKWYGNSTLMQLIKIHMKYSYHFASFTRKLMKYFWARLLRCNLCSTRDDVKWCSPQGIEYAWADGFGRTNLMSYETEFFLTWKT